MTRYLSPGREKIGRKRKMRGCEISPRKTHRKTFFRFWPKLLQTQPNSGSRDVLCLRRDELLAHQKRQCSKGLQHWRDMISNGSRSQLNKGSGANLGFGASFPQTAAEDVSQHW